MRGNDGSTDRKAKTHSLRFGGEERLEDLFHLVLRNAAAPVGDRYNHCAAAILDSGANEKSALRTVAIGHRVTSVDHQVKQNLLKLNRVAGDRGQILREFKIHGDLLIQQIATHQLQNIAYNFVDTERMLLHLAFFQQKTQAADHFGSTLVFAYNFIKNFGKLGEVGVAVREDSLASLRVEEDGAEREVKFVRKRARK